MIIAKKKKVELMGTKEILKEELENIIIILTKTTEIFTVKEIMQMLKCKPIKQNKLIEYFEKKKRMKELDKLLTEIRRKKR